MKKLCGLLILLFPLLLQAQPYLEKQTRHRFAQLNLGLDVQYSSPAQGSWLRNGTATEQRIDGHFRPRILIGGTHFWGHADFMLAIPLGRPVFSEQDQHFITYSGVETAFKYYPWRMQSGKIRPFAGVSLLTWYYEQRQGKDLAGNGPELHVVNLPLSLGMNYMHGRHLLELGVLWNHQYRQQYAISSQQFAPIQLSQWQLGLSWRWLLETTLSAEKGWESGRTSAVTEKLAAAGKLDGWFVGAGFSSVFWLANSVRNEQLYPFVGKPGTSLMPDFSLGYYWHQADAQLNLSYRGYRTATQAYGVQQTLQRRSLGLEFTKMLFDYHGFVPFIGPILSREQLLINENNNVYQAEDFLWSAGLTFGWDIRPDRLQRFVLRTNLRWYPALKLQAADANFNALEFNFIQLVVYPQRFAL